MPSVVGLAVRSRKQGPMREIESDLVAVDGGLAADIPVARDRGLTLLSREQWSEVQRELGVDLPWHTRRANVLVEGLPLGDLIGQRLRLGEVELEIIDETRPCEMMDRLHQGLRATLEPQRRGGVHGRVVRGGRLRLGDPVRVVPAAPTTPVS